MGSLQTEKPRPHALCIPFPAQGHINPMLKLAKLLHHRGFHITFVHTDFNHHRLLKSRGPAALRGIPSFHFETIPDGLPPPAATDSTQHVPSLCDSTRKNCSVPLRNLINKLNNAGVSSGVPPVTCVIADGVMSFAVLVAQELGIPGVLFWTTSACGFMGYVQYRKLVDEGLIPFKDSHYLTNGELDAAIDWIPGVNGMQLKHIPTFIRTTDPNDIMIDFVLGEIERAHKATAILLNTFHALEHNFVDAISTKYPNTYTIGPLQLLLNQIPQNDLETIGSNLWKEEDDCLTWLDSKDPNSVVYVNFGSVTIMTPQQLVEFAWGLANSNQAFLWIIRPDSVAGDLAILLGEFVMETKERGLLANWCPQEDVLTHSSIGVFLTHCGWNSTLESICSGVPVICWPFFAEQNTNCWCCCTQWGVGEEINIDVKREEVENLVRELVVGERGRERKRKAMEWKKKAEEATAYSVGSSYMGFENVVQCVLKSNVVD
ncbi:7-deoxyloganetin glucosyltransferase-like isoform X1 [Actinidia eriantha]|uniref:7-deoxyloganetin glucosyltransferase-like isoform X1 n=1 Tax=Actinidia eriantha TaxID=165200 RepID=UPI0025836171|nr:7-deoxyloganetin glucosyltransferase-like isoform X1 [Actinidia eriantha]